MLPPFLLDKHGAGTLASVRSFAEVFKVRAVRIAVVQVFVVALT